MHHRISHTLNMVIGTKNRGSIRAETQAMAQYVISYVSGGHFENGRKYVVCPDNMLMESLFVVGGGLRTEKNLVSDCPGGGGAL